MAQAEESHELVVLKQRFDWSEAEKKKVGHQSPFENSCLVK
jgi:hypothetical protein